MDTGEDYKNQISSHFIHSDSFITNLDKTMGRLFLSALLNWHNLSQDQNVMSVLSMENNSLCRKIKQQNPTYHDSFVQAHVLTLMLTLFLVISRTNNNADNNIPMYVANTLRPLLFGQTNQTDIIGTNNQSNNQLNKYHKDHPDALD